MVIHSQMPFGWRRRLPKVRRSPSPSVRSNRRRNLHARLEPWGCVWKFAYLSAETAQANTDDESFIDGAPALVVEILSPSDKHEEVTEKVDVYLDAGVKLVWVADPSFRTITVYRADAPPQLFNETQTIDAEPHLPGFRAAVSEVFAR